jgi:hypothetical protein
VEDYLLLEMGLLGGYFVEEEKNDRKSPICTGKNATVVCIFSPKPINLWALELDPFVCGGCPG